MKKLLLLLFMLTINVGIIAQISHIGDIGSNNIKNSSIADLVVTTTAAVTAGDDIIIAYATDPSQDLTITITDAAGNKYQQSAMAISVGNMRTYIFAAYNVAALSSGTTITITQTVVSSTVVTARAAVVSVFRGLAAVGALEQTNVSSGTSTSPSSGNATTLYPDQLLIGAVGTEGPVEDAAGTWGGSFTAAQRAGTTGSTADGNITVSMGWRIVSSGGSYSASKSSITSRDWAATIATFKPSDDGISYIGNIGSAQTKASSGTTLAITTTESVTAGDDIFVVFAMDGNSNAVSISDGASNTYSQLVNAQFTTPSTSNVRTVIFTAHNVSALSSGSTITITHPSVTARSAVVSVFRGLSGLLDRTQSNTGTTASVTSNATSTTTQAYELLIGGVGLEGPNYDAPSVWQNSFTYGPRLGTNFGSGSGGGDGDITVQMGWRIVGSTAAYTAQLINLNTTRDWAACIVTLKGTYEDPPVPVELTAFTATMKNHSILLNWETATEVSNYGFEVERSNDKTNWSKLAFVNGHGNSNSTKQYSYTDSKVSTGKYYYRLKQIDTDGAFEYSNEVEVSTGEMLTDYVVEQNFPNPFNPATTIKFGFRETVDAKVVVYNALGSEVATLFNEKVEAGKVNSVDFDGSHLASGIYFYAVTAGNFKSVKKMILIK